ncbi:MAG: polysaccharide deacetylase family protein [Candidatus Geothermincolia bacterium]
MTGHRRAGVKLTRRFYYIAGAFAAFILLLAVIAAVSSGGESGYGEGSLGVGDLQRLKVTEAGSIMVIQYQKIGEEASGSRSADSFRRELETLYAEGYRVISLTDLATNNIDVAPGTTPVVITFDDSDSSQLRFSDGNRLDPTCAVAIMEQFAKEHPDFGLTATFFVLPKPFGQEDLSRQKMQYLVDHGYDIGNHTASHGALNKLTDEQVQKEIVDNLLMVQGYLPGYEQKSIALVGEAEPANKALLVTGAHEGTSYEFNAALLPGYVPSPPPCVAGFDPMRLTRVRSLALSLDKENLGSEAWLEYFRLNPERRYRSDGDPSVITVPQFMASRINQDQLAGKRLRTY